MPANSLQFTGVLSYPKPVSATGHPGVVRRRKRGGAAPGRRIRRRLARLQGRRRPRRAAKIRRIEELLQANGRKRSDVTLAVSPYTEPITAG